MKKKPKTVLFSSDRLFFLLTFKHKQATYRSQKTIYSQEDRNKRGTQWPQINLNPHTTTFTPTIYHLKYSSSPNLMPSQRQAYSALLNTQISHRQTTHTETHIVEWKEMNT